MTFREVRDHKFKILFMYYFMQSDIDQLIFNYFENAPYEEDDENEYIVGNSKAHKNIAKVNISDEIFKVNENVSDRAISISLSDEDNKRDITNKVKEIIEKIPILDEMISNSLETWDIKRVAKPELIIIRLAVFEMYYDNSIDIKVAINEAIDLAKTYGDNKAGKFVNGVLATIYKKKGDGIDEESSVKEPE